MNYIDYLIIGVIRRAMEDYKRALRKQDLNQIEELEQFFLSEYGQAMTCLHGAEIIEYCKKLVAEKSRIKRAYIRKQKHANARVVAVVNKNN